MKKKNSITWVRTQLNLTQAEYADILNVSRSALSNYESGQRPMSAEASEIHEELLLQLSNTKNFTFDKDKWTEQYSKGLKPKLDYRIKSIQISLQLAINKLAEHRLKYTTNLDALAILHILKSESKGKRGASSRLWIDKQISIKERSLAESSPEVQAELLLSIAAWEASLRKARNLVAGKKNVKTKVVVGS